MNWHVLDAVFKRNFVSYFSSPTGYVFICVFVLLGSLAAFWPPEFFNSNLANLDQLNRYLPYILLVFIPAITMSVWADERRQGTDELLLTIPASDWEVVFGKYLATVGIYTVALMFSCICNLIILLRWGTPDGGLFFANYLGYWFVGLAMLDAGVDVFLVLADDDDVQIRVEGLNKRNIGDAGPDVRIESQRLADHDVEALKAATLRSRDRRLEKCP